MSVARGEWVEERRGWIFEGAWAGPFGDGGFDRCEAVFGSGIRVRDGRVVFVGSGTLVDRLWCYRGEGTRWVGNSLPGLLLCADDRLRSSVDYGPFNRNLATEAGGLPDMLPTERGEIAPVYFNNIAVEDGRHAVVPKPDAIDGFPRFEAYRDRLRSVADGLRENATSADRRVDCDVVSTISRGYDSPAAAVVARRAGCDRTVSIRRARSVLPRDDSGAPVARQLGMECLEVDVATRGCEHELAFWAGCGNGDERHMASLPVDSTGPTLLFTGAFGDGIWKKDASKHRSVVPWRPLPTLLGLCEYRLLEGWAHCPVPYVGRRHGFDLLRISHAPEMRRWSVDGSYDRPIPRRIVEEAGVDRDLFGQRKAAVQFEDSFQWPAGERLQDSYRSYLAAAGTDPPPVRSSRLAGRIDRLVLKPLGERTPLETTAIRRRLRGSGTHLFDWANNLMADRLAAGEAV